jgi:molecular chaperone GrpE
LVDRDSDHRQPPPNPDGVSTTSEPETGVPSTSPRLKVVDRRWWARDEPADGEEQREPRKPTYVEQLEEKVAEKDRLLQSYIAKHQEAVGEFEQVRARIRRDVAKDVERARRTVLAELLQVVDNLDRAIQAAAESKNFNALLDGVELVRRDLLATLEGFGVKRADTLGQPFDPLVHEAITTVATPSADQDGIVLGVIREGYTIGEDVLRPALVAVAKVQPPATDTMPER